MTACLPKLQRPREVGLSSVNRVGIAPNAAGVPMLCYAGSRENLELLSGLPEVQRWPEWDCLALPFCRENLLLLETVGQIQEPTEEYIQVRDRLLQVPQEVASLYPEPTPGQPKPFKHQVDAFCLALDAFRQFKGGFASFAEMGTGKSRWCIDVLRFIADNALSVIIVQNSTALQWQQNLASNWPEAAVTLLTGIPIPERVELIRAAANAERPHILLVNWEALARLVEPFCRAKPAVVVADEASRMKDRNSQMAKAAFSLADASEFRIVMTGTPLGNNPGDLWSLYRFMDASIFGKSYWAFARQYFKLGGFTGNEFTGFDPQNIGEFISKVYSCAYRITKACIADMPEKTRDEIVVPMSGEQARIYQQVKTALYAEWQLETEKHTLTVANVLSQALRLQQITAGLFPTTDDNKTVVRIESAKTQWVANYVSELIDVGDSQVVIWTRFKEELALLFDALIGAGISADAVGRVDGSVKMQVREELRLAFNDRSNPLRVLLCQIQSSAYGLDIPSCDTMIYHSGTFSYLERAQSEDRGHRLGRIRPYNIIDVLCDKTIDFSILQAIKKKQNLSDLLLVKGFSEWS